MKNVVFIDPNKLHLKGNIHLHTTRSDGKLTPFEIANRYHSAGYDFIMMSDHEIYWNSNELDLPDFLVLGGTETAVRMNDSHRWILDYTRRDLGNVRAQHTHMHLGCIKDESIPDEGQYFPHNFPVPRMLDRGIDSWNQQVEYMRQHGNLVFVNHPHWSRLAPELLLAMQNITGFEIWNSGDVMKCGGRADEDIWDYCLSRGKKLLAQAGDDAHECTTDFGAGFTMVECDQFTKADICTAFKQGKFYASCGPVIHEMCIKDGKLHMRFSPVRQVKLVAYDRDGANFHAADDALLEEIEWKVDPTIRYFRPVLIDETGKQAWCQPIFVEELLDS